MSRTFTISAGATMRALVFANARYWTTVAPLVRRELRAWAHRAEAIPDPTWRAIARRKLAVEHFNAEVAATLATLAPAPHRTALVRAIVALQVMYDYLDGASEHASERTAGGAHLYEAFSTALGQRTLTTGGYYRDLSADDGGYLEQLARATGRSLVTFPAAARVAPIAWQAANRCATAQALTHRIERDGTDPLRAWSLDPATRASLAWWEYAAGGAASVLAVHALLATATDGRTTAADAHRLDDAYLLICALSTLLDSIVDAERDARDGGHSFVAYYASAEAQATGVAGVARHAVLATTALPRAPHHLMTVAGVAGYYLSAPEAATPAARSTAALVEHELRPILAPILGVFAGWRAAKHLRRGARGTDLRSRERRRAAR